MRDYCLIEAESPRELENKVNAKLAKGYQVCGGVCLVDAMQDTQGGPILTTCFFQAVVYPFDG